MELDHRPFVVSVTQPMPAVQIHLDYTSGQPNIPTRFHDGDAGYDLYTSREIVVPAAHLVSLEEWVVSKDKERSFTPGFADVHTDVYLQLPTGFYGRITGRSSTIRKHGLQVQEGIIDTGYTGELFIGVWNLRPTSVTVPVGTRLAQLLLHQHAPRMVWVQTSSKPDALSGRGERGFGSTGE